MNQMSMDFSAPKSVNPYKIKIASVKIDRAEGPYTPGKPMPSAAVKTVAKANKILQEWALTAPKKGGGYDKCDLQIVWEDGTAHCSRIDLKREHACEGMLIQTELELTYEFYAGEHCPAHMTQETYQQYLDTNEKHDPGSKNEAKRMLVAYRFW